LSIEATKLIAETSRSGQEGLCRSTIRVSSCSEKCACESTVEATVVVEQRTDSQESLRWASVGESCCSGISCETVTIVEAAIAIIHYRSTDCQECLCRPTVGERGGGCKGRKGRAETAITTVEAIVKGLSSQILGYSCTIVGSQLGLFQRLFHCIP
jgi:hypothetical protein